MFFAVNPIIEFGSIAAIAVVVNAFTCADVNAVKALGVNKKAPSASIAAIDEVLKKPHCAGFNAAICPSPVK